MLIKWKNKIISMRIWG